MSDSETSKGGCSAVLSNAGLEEGSTVKVTDEALNKYGHGMYRKCIFRTGTVERVFVPLGATRETARVRWHKRGNRGKEFVEFHRASDLEVVPSN